VADDRDIGINLGFLSAALADSSALQLVGVSGHEEISRPFEFELFFLRHGEPLTQAELKELVRQPCVVALGFDKSDLVHGILVSIEHLDSERHAVPAYVARMVPQVALMDLGKRSAIFRDMTIPEIVGELLKAHGLSAGRTYEILVTEEAKSPKREYVVQYQESDWSFIQRWLEHEGYFYWFEHSNKGAKLVIADANDDASTIDEPSVISFRERNNLATSGAHTIWDFRVQQRRIPARVTLVDYNYRRPTEMLISSHAVDRSGFGHVYQYGDHVKDRDVGDTMARIRAEELGATQRIVRGVTDCTRFRVGHVFELENHHTEDYDKKYLITKIQHRVGLETPTLRADRRAEGEQTPSAYTAIFEAIPLSVPFRPRRITPWPRISGLITGHVEADTAGDYAQIDEMGRYKVKMPFDVGSRAGLSSSRWIRMAQSYAGAGYGMHFPLHKGTEVLIAHVDGDPDRPIVVGSVPNAVTPGPVADANATQSVLQTASGMRVELEDLQG
jgi:type VI secretion system secreted protein VgrG